LYKCYNVLDNIIWSRSDIDEKKNKGFTLVEIITVIVIIGSISVVKYIENSKQKTYDSFAEELRAATNNLMIDCMTENEEGCVIPEHGNEIRIKDRTGNLSEEYSYVINKIDKAIPKINLNYGFSNTSSGEYINKIEYTLVDDIGEIDRVEYALKT